MSDTKTRERFRKFAVSRKMIHQEQTVLKDDLENSHPNVCRVLEECEELFQGYEQFPSAIWVFFKCLSSASAVCSYFPANGALPHLVRHLAAGLVIRKDPESFADLQSYPPIVYGVLKSLPAVSLSPAWDALFCELNEQAEKILKFDQHKLGYDQNDYSGICGYFPAWPRLCNHGRYLMDDSKKETHKSCSKTYPGHPNLMPGIFTMYCCYGLYEISTCCFDRNSRYMHVVLKKYFVFTNFCSYFNFTTTHYFSEICYGFAVMESPESTNVPFTIVRTRFPTGVLTIV
eukprot:gene6490-7234_t